MKTKDAKDLRKVLTRIFNKSIPVEYIIRYIEHEIGIWSRNDRPKE